MRSEGVASAQSQQGTLARSRTTAYGWEVRPIVVRVSVAASSLLALACSGSTSSYTSDADRGTTHAIITVERREAVGASSVSQAKAFASFVRTPPDVDAAAVTRVTGLDLDLPEVGDCVIGGSNRDSVALSPLRRVELLAAGDVALETPSGRVELAPHAFPAVTDVVSGVVYTTRDRTAALPAGEPYALSAGGGPFLSPLAVSAEAPPSLTAVALDAAPLDSTSAFLPRESQLSWRAGSARDLVYVKLAGSDAAQGASTCVFRDDAGRGLIPAAMIPRSGPIQLSLHRLRSVALGSTPGDGIDVGELRFDFELSAVVALAER